MDKINTIYIADARMVELPENIQFCYIDPPFYTQREFDDFSDKHDDIQTYLSLITTVAIRIYPKLKDGGAFAIHCDYHASHYIKTAMDSIFGYENFMNEIFTMRSSKNMTVMKSRLNINVDSILVWWKGKGTIYEFPKKPRDKNSSDWASVFSGGSGGPMLVGEKLIYPPDGRHFMWSQDHINEQFKLGNVKITSGNRVLYKVLNDHITLGNLWNDIPSYSHKHDYDTEKSEELMTRLVTMFTKNDDLVVDLFCGSGTTIVVAKKLGRQVFGCDINKDAVDLTWERVMENEED